MPKVFSDDSPMILQISAMVNANRALVHRGRFVSTTFVIGVDDRDYFVTVERGRITALETRQRPLQRWQFALRAAAPDWQKFWQPMPAPGWHDLFAMAKSGRLEISGDILPFMANLRFFKELLASPRGHASTGSIEVDLQ